MSKKTFAEAGTVRSLAEVILRARGAANTDLTPAVFLVGAGCSLSAGIPLVSSIAQHCCVELGKAFFCPEDILKSAGLTLRWLVAETRLNLELPDEGIEPNWPAVYDAIFAQQYTSPDEVRDVFAWAIGQGAGKINWAHLCLGELVLQRFVSTVITTNFDQLALEGMVRAGVIPVVSDGFESLNRIQGRPGHPQLIQIHGSRHTYILRNKPDDVTAVAEDPAARSAFAALIQHCRVFVVVGYGGREAGVMDLLQSAFETWTDKPIYWIAHEPKWEGLEERARSLLQPNANARVVYSQDADGFFAALSRELRVGSPQFIRSPAASLVDLAGRISHNDDKDIAAEIRDHRAELDHLKACVDDYRARLDESEKAKRSGREKRLAGDLRGALAEYQKAVSVRENDPSLLAAIADIAEDLAKLEVGGKYEQIVVWAAEKLIEISPRDVQPTRWGDGQHWLGLGKTLLAAQTIGQGEQKELSEAAHAFRLALEVWSRDGSPELWAMAQNNLGNVLVRLGMRTNNEQGVSLIQEAIAAYRAALTVYSLTSHSARWASGTVNLGQALYNLGERILDDEIVSESLATIRSALVVFTREDRPVDWAATLHSLGTVLGRIGERTQGKEGVEKLNEAAGAFRSTLEVYSRADTPSDWAMAQNNLGNVLIALADRTEPPVSIRHLNEAAAVFRGVLEIYSRRDTPKRWATTQNNLGIVLTELGEATKKGRMRLFDEAAIAFRAALEVYTKEDPLERASTQTNLGSALKRQAKYAPQSSRMQLLLEAIASYRQALAVQSKSNMPLDWAISEHNLATALIDLAGGVEGSDALQHLREARRLYAEALEVFKAGNSSLYAASAERQIAHIDSLLDRLE